MTLSDRIQALDEAEAQLDALLERFIAALGTDGAQIVVPQIVKARLGTITRQRDAQHGLRKQGQGTARADIQPR
jgi:Ribonuclease G/E